MQSSMNVSDGRSYEVAFLSFCLLCRGVVAQGLVKQFSSVVQPVVQELVRRDINIVQMPCPEMLVEGYSHGLKRTPKLKTDYDIPEFRSVCRTLGEETVDLLEAMQGEGFKIKAVLGIEYSPSCAVNYVFKSVKSSYSSRGYTSHEEGIFIEELQAILSKRDIQVPFVGVHLRGMNKTLKTLHEILGVQDAAQLQLL